MDTLETRLILENQKSILETQKSMLETLKSEFNYFKVGMCLLVKMRMNIPSKVIHPQLLICYPI